MTKVLLTIAVTAVCIVLSGALLPAPAQTPVPKAADPTTAQGDPYQQGLAFLKSGALGDAEVAFRRALQVDAKAMGPMLGLADIALRRKQIAVAEKWINEALIAYPDRTETLVGAARLQQAKGDYEKAIALLERATVVDDKSTAALLDLGDIYLLVKRQPSRAEEKFREATARDKKNAAAHHGLAASLVQLKKLDEARAAAAEAAKLAPQNPGFQLTLSRINLALNRPDDALKAADAAAKLDARSAAAQAARGNALLRRKDLERALQAFGAATKIEPDLVEAWASIGLIHQIFARWPEAEAAYHRSLALKMDQPVILNNLAWILANENRDLDIALERAKRAVELDPRYGPFHDTLGWVYRARGDLTSAAAALEKATKLPPPNPETYLRLALVYSQGGDKALALAALDKALALNPDMKEAQEARKRLQAN